MAAIMPTLLSAIANGARQGILFKNGAQLEKIGQVRAIAFDKTGTLTTGELQVCEVIPYGKYSQTDVLTAAASLESYSEHPIGKAIVQAAANIDWVGALEVQAIPGKGISGIIQEQQVMVGNAAFISEYVPEFPQDLQNLTQFWEQEGKTVVWVAQTRREDGYEIVGTLAIADMVRAEAAETIKRLRKLGVAEIVMITGDNQRTAHSVAQTVGIDRVYAELLPEDKLSVISDLQKKYQTVAMVGDGINDAPALAQASVGIAMGVAGSDVALETADVVLMADKLEKIAVAMHLGRRSQSIVKQNIVVALGFILLLLIGNFLGNINLPIGVIGHEGSTVLVTLSGLRLLK